MPKCLECPDTLHLMPSFVGRVSAVVECMESAMEVLTPCTVCILIRTGAVCGQSHYVYMLMNNYTCR